MLRFVNAFTQLLYTEGLRTTLFQVEQELRNESFGYRAKFIQQAAVEINDKGGLNWFQKVQNMDYKDAHAELVTLTGIGPKVKSNCLQ